jgi:hypothetical protein
MTDFIFITELFPKSIGNISDTYYTDITPAGWTFSIWGFIYTWQVNKQDLYKLKQLYLIIFNVKGIWLVYSFVCLFRRTKSGYYLYIKPDFFHYGIFIAYIANLISNIIWIFLWGYEHLGVSLSLTKSFIFFFKSFFFSLKQWSLLFIVSIMVCLYISLFISYRKLHQNEQKLRDEGL